MARSALLNVMTSAALKAGRALSRDFGEVQNLQVSMKGPGDFVSNADKNAEKIIRVELDRARPGYGFVMEESGERKGRDNNHRWIVDPLDGTTNFLHAIPIFAVSIALERDGEIVAGVIYNPAMDELYVAERGSGAFLNDRRLRVANRRELVDCVVGRRNSSYRAKITWQVPGTTTPIHAGNIRHQADGGCRTRPCLCGCRAAGRLLGAGAFVLGHCGGNDHRA